MTAARIVLKAEDFAAWDRDEPAEVGHELMSELHDLLFHTYNEGDGWSPFADEADIPAVIAEVRGHIERIEEAARQARRRLAAIERVARLAAYRRIKAERAVSQPAGAESAEDGASATYPDPGSEIPGQPGYVVGTCGHRVAGSEWRAGFRVCERCPDDADEQDDGEVSEP